MTSSAAQRFRSSKFALSVMQTGAMVLVLGLVAPVARLEPRPVPTEASASAQPTSEASTLVSLGLVRSSAVDTVTAESAADRAALATDEQATATTEALDTTAAASGTTRALGVATTETETVAAAAKVVKRTYPWHKKINATTFWVGEVFDASASDGSQMFSTYDDDWYKRYGGCDGVIKKKICKTEKRVKKNGYFPRNMKPKQNPFYLDLPYDDINDSVGFKKRDKVIPWAKDPAYRKHKGDRSFSYMKNRWVQIKKGNRVCYGQIQDAGPATYHDATYVFGKKNNRPTNKKYNKAGMDVSPALTGCLGFKDLDGNNNIVSWRFVEANKVPAGPWKKIVTKTQVNNY